MPVVQLSLGLRCPSRGPFYFFFNDPATTEIYTLSLHDALPIWKCPKWTLHSGSIEKREPVSIPDKSPADLEARSRKKSADDLSQVVDCSDFSGDGVRDVKSRQSLTGLDESVAFDIYILRHIRADDLPRVVNSGSRGSIQWTGPWHINQGENATIFEKAGVLFAPLYNAHNLTAVVNIDGCRNGRARDLNEFEGIMLSLCG